MKFLGPEFFKSIFAGSKMFSSTLSTKYFRAQLFFGHFSRRFFFRQNLFKPKFFLVGANIFGLDFFFDKLFSGPTSLVKFFGIRNFRVDFFLIIFLGPTFFVNFLGLKFLGSIFFVNFVRDQLF